MNHPFEKYFHKFSEDSPAGSFHSIIPLHESPDVSWEAMKALVPSLSKAWFELAQLNNQDRIDFLLEYWLGKMLYRPSFVDFLKVFFQSLDHIGIYLTQKAAVDPFVPQVVYSLKNNSGYYRGMLPATDQEILDLQAQFSEVILPADFLAFLQIHNGFYKTTDATGITSTHAMHRHYLEFQKSFEPEEIIYTQSDQPVNPKNLYPFYQSFDTPFYQCFWSEWYPENEMGVVYYSGITKNVSDTNDDGATIEHLCFSTFTDWLIFYLEPVIP